LQDCQLFDLPLALLIFPAIEDCSLRFRAIGISINSRDNANRSAKKETSKSLSRLSCLEANGGFSNAEVFCRTRWRRCDRCAGRGVAGQRQRRLFLERAFEVQDQPDEPAAGEANLPDHGILVLIAEVATEALTPGAFWSNGQG
jgi:hypothetical protein